MTSDLETRLREYGPVLDGAGLDVETEPTPVRRARRRAVALSAAAAVVLAAVVTGAVLRPAGHPVTVTPGAGGDQSAIGVSRRVLIDGWRVTYADQQVVANDKSGREEVDDYRYARDRRQLELNIAGGGAEALASYVDDRAAEGGSRQTTEVLGHPATLLANSQRESLMWLDGDVLFRLEGDVGSADDMLTVARTIRVADPSTWEAAMPASSVLPSARPATVDEMLAGIPKPPGFDPTALRAEQFVSDRYQLGAHVVSLVVCGWLGEWFAGRDANDAARQHTALSALQTDDSWPVFVQMDPQGAYHQIVHDTVVRLGGGGTFKDVPLDPNDMRNGFGCTG